VKLLALMVGLAAALCAVVFIWSAGSAGSAHIAGSSPGIGSSSRADTFPCTVTKVHDGDGPIWCAEGPKIRLTAIAARELDETCSAGHPCPSASGAEAQRELEALATGRRLQCERTGTSYKRVTAWCWREDGLELNCAMVKSGKALAWKRYDPDERLCS
jgi:endonuclease YncB( thermonuclease family)